MINLQYLTLDVRDRIGIVKFNNPKSLNALSTELLRELRTLLLELKNDTRPRVLVLTGEGRAFVAGGDIKEMSEKTPLEAREFSRLGNSVMSCIEDYPIPVIAAVNGYALGGGLELVLSADFAYASKSAKFGLPELTLGLIPGFGGSRRLSDRIGMSQAKELIFSGRIIDAEEALKLKIVNRVTESEDLLPAVMNVACEIAGVSPHAIKETKELLAMRAGASRDEVIATEVHKFGMMFAHDDAKAGLSAFIQKQKPIWKEDT